MNPSSAKTDCDEKCFYEQYEECRYTENHNVECYSSVKIYKQCYSQYVYYVKQGILNVVSDNVIILKSLLKIVKK